MSDQSSSTNKKVPIIDTTKGSAFAPGVDRPAQPPQELVSQKPPAQGGKKSGK